MRARSEPVESFDTGVEEFLGRAVEELPDKIVEILRKPLSWNDFYVTARPPGTVVDPLQKEKGGTG